jgi:leucyl aminopeptidase
MIRVSPKQVKQSAAALLPPATPFRIVQAPGRITRRSLATVDHVIVLTPAAVPTTLLRTLPELRALRRVATRLGKKGATQVLRGRLAGSAVGISWSRLPAPGRDNDGQQAFRALKLAGELVADALVESPRSVALLVDGFVEAERYVMVRAVLLAIGARAFDGPAFRREREPSRLRTVRVPGLRERIDVARTLAEIDNANLVRWLAALPANKLDATAYREIIAVLARRHGWEFEFYDETRLRQLGAGAFLAVSQGSPGRGAGMARLRYRPARRRGTDVALVGKGILFDTGGTNLKAAQHMLDMHIDMAGSAVALGVLRALTVLEAPLAVDCWLAITENRTGPDAYKPRDVVTASNGVTIEVIHTDAEGRMALADALALAGREKPRLIVDYATLTGACVTAVSERYSGVFTNRPALNELLIAVGRASGERVWPFPLDEDFDEDLRSSVADVAQCTMTGAGDHILAARLLSRFVPRESSWIHMDLSAVERKTGLAHLPSGLTGFGVRWTLALLLDNAAALEAVTGPLRNAGSSKR